LVWLLRVVAAEAVGIHRGTVNKWISADLYSFKKGMDLAHDDYCDWIQGIIRDRIANPQGKRGSDVLVMFAATAERPEKYREEVKVIGMEASKQMLDRLREMAMKERERQEALEQGGGCGRANSGKRLITKGHFAYNCRNF
jgi:hypothetical protein